MGSDEILRFLQAITCRPPFAAGSERAAALAVRSRMRVR